MLGFFQGANINAQDANNRTPLFVAASKRAWKTVNLLIKRGANMTLKDEKSRNFLHVIIKGGGSLNLIEDEVIKVSFTIIGCSVIWGTSLRVVFITLIPIVLVFSHGMMRAANSMVINGEINNIA